MDVRYIRQTIQSTYQVMARGVDGANRSVITSKPL
jgi:hypothetical protein